MSEQSNPRGMTRDELNEYAESVGIADAASYPNKDALCEAIEAQDSVEGTQAPDDDAGDDPQMPEDDAFEGGDDLDAPAGVRYHVLKAFTLADGRTVMPGAEWTPDASFPARRPKQLVDQKFLRPID